MADSTITTLLENIQTNLKDSTNYATVAGALAFVEISDQWFPLPKGTPYAVIVPGAPGDAEQLIATRVWSQPVSIYVAIRSMMTPEGDRALLGTDQKSGLDTIALEVRKALARPSPYYDRKPDSTYTEQEGVLFGECTEMEYMGFETDDETETSGIQVVRVEVTYLVSEAKY